MCKYKVAIVGSRTLADYQFFKHHIDSIVDNIELIVSGGCSSGADFLAERYAQENNIPTLIFPANWNKYGKQAGYLRNIEVVNAVDAVIAFWDGTSKGTLLTINIAKKKQVPCKVILTCY